MTDDEEFPNFNELNVPEESDNSLDADMYDEHAIGSPAPFDQDYSERDEEGNDVLDELEGMRPQRRIVFAQIEEGEVSGNNIPLDPTDSETMNQLFDRKGSNYLVYYTKCVIYLMQKYGALTTRQLASLIGNLESKQLYDIMNVLCEYKILIRGSSEDGFLFRFCTENVPDPISDINNLEEEISKIATEIERVQAQLNDLST